VYNALEGCPNVIFSTQVLVRVNQSIVFEQFSNAALQYKEKSALQFSITTLQYQDNSDTIA